MEFKNRLSKLRKNKNMTQTELASRLNVKQYVISSWEIGRSEPNMHQLVELADLFDIPIDYLVGRDVIMTKDEKEYKKITDMINKDINDDFLNKVKEICGDISDSDKEKILDVIDASVKLIG